MKKRYSNSYVRQNDETMEWHQWPKRKMNTKTPQKYAFVSKMKSCDCAGNRPITLENATECPAHSHHQNLKQSKAMLIGALPSFQLETRVQNGK